MGKNKSERAGGPFVFRVSDSVDVPLRGLMLRLRLVEGTPAMGDLGRGARLRLRSPVGATREVEILDHAVTGGRPTQARLDRTRELDVLVARPPAEEKPPLDIGWMAEGPVDDAADRS